MTIVEEFKAKIKAGRFTEALRLAISESVSFKVTTCLSQEQYISTRVNLAEGKIENDIGEKILANESYQQLCQLHLDQVQQGQEIILNNLSSFKAILAMLEETPIWSSQEITTNSRESLAFKEISDHDGY